MSHLNNSKFNFTVLANLNSSSYHENSQIDIDTSLDKIQDNTDCQIKDQSKKISNRSNRKSPKSSNGRKIARMARILTIV